MDFKDSVGFVEESKEFKDFAKKNPHYYLVHVFSVADSFNDSVWQIGYYNKETDKIIVFENNNDLILIHPPEEALKKEEYIQKLDIDKLKISRSDASSACDEVIKENYKHETLNKAIFLLQNLPEFGEVWNITIITSSFSVINIKIDAITGNVVKHEKQSLMGWKG